MPHTAESWLRAADFWNYLTAKQKLKFVEVTQNVPMDYTGGLWDTYAKLWQEQPKRKTWLLLMLIYRACLNSFAIYSQAMLGGFEVFQIGWGSVGDIVLVQEVNFMLNISVTGDWQESNLTMNWQDNSREWRNVSRGASGLGFGVMLVRTTEVVVASLLLFGVFVTFFRFVVRGRSHVMVKYRPLFTVAPRLLGTFSALKLLRFGNPAIIRTVHPAMCRVVLVVVGKRAMQSRITPALGWILTVFVIGGSILLGAAAFLVKVHMVFFVIMVPMTDWYLAQFIQVLSLLNQLVAIVDVEMVEVDRLFLFRFGGSDSKFTLDEIQLTNDYMDLLVLGVLHGRFVIKMRGRFLAWVCMANITSHDVQLLWFSKDTEDEKKSMYSYVREVIMLDKVWAAQSWPPQGADPRFSRRAVQQELQEESMVEMTSQAEYEKLWHAGRKKDVRPGHFLDNMQSYHMWLVQCAEDKEQRHATGSSIVANNFLPKLYDENGNLGEGTAMRAVSPRVTHLTEYQDKLLRAGSPGAYHVQDLYIAMRLQKEIDDLKGLGWSGQVDSTSLNSEPIPTLYVQTSMCLLRCLNYAVPRNQEKAQLQIFLEQMWGDKAISVGRLSMMSEMSQPNPSRGEGEEDPVSWLIEELTAFECFFGLKAVMLESTWQLQAALRSMNLPDRLSSVRIVVEQRALFLQELRRFKKVLGAQLSHRSYDSTYDLQLIHRGEELLERLATEELLLGAESEGYEVRLMLRELRGTWCCCFSARLPEPKGPESLLRPSMSIPTHQGIIDEEEPLDGPQGSRGVGAVTMETNAVWAQLSRESRAGILEEPPPGWAAVSAPTASERLAPRGGGMAIMRSSPSDQQAYRSAQMARGSEQRHWPSAEARRSAQMARGSEPRHWPSAEARRSAQLARGS